MSSLMPSLSASLSEPPFFQYSNLAFCISQLQPRAWPPATICLHVSSSSKVVSPSMIKNSVSFPCGFLGDITEPGKEWALKEYF